MLLLDILNSMHEFHEHNDLNDQFLISFINVYNLLYYYIDILGELVELATW